MADLKLQIENLHKTFDPGLFEAKRHVLKGLSLSVQSGEIFGFLGPNGAGKTTTIKAVNGLIFPDAGEITVCGLPHDSLEAKRRLGYMPENPYFYQHLKGIEFLEFYARLVGLDESVAKTRIGELLERVSMAPAAKLPMRTYSKGMLQRMGLAQALLGKPELLILDEPMSGLDPIGRRDVRDIILEQRRAGTTVFFSSHIIPDVETICDRVAVINDGVLQAEGSVREIVARDSGEFEITFSGVDPGSLKTPIVSANTGSETVWIRVQAEQRDAAIRELTDLGAHLLAVAPVRNTLEAFLLEHYREVDA